MTDEEKCNLFEECEAPICPLQKNTVEHGIWYADEQVCRARRFQRLPWVKRQKKIAKFALASIVNCLDIGFFSVRMLENIHRLSKGTQGANPDNIDSEEQWLKERQDAKNNSSNKAV